MGGFLGKEIEEEDGGGHWLEVWSEAGPRLLSAGTISDPGLESLGGDKRGGLRQGRTVVNGHGPLRVMTDRVVVAGRPFIIRAAVSEAGNRVFLRVQDEGPGISVSAQPQVFERFWCRNRTL